MPRTQHKHPILHNLEIIDIAAEGKAVAKFNDMIVFVSNAVPGDVIDIQITHKSKNFREGYPVFFHKYSDNRIDAFCSHFGICGGCKWQNLKYEQQLFYKQKQVTDCLQRIAKVKLPEINPILHSEHTVYYRNKLEFTFSNKRWLTKEEMHEDGINAEHNMNGLGFHVPGMFDKVLDIDKCYLQNELVNIIRNEVKKFALENSLTFFDLRKQEGFLRNIIFRNTASGHLMVIFVFFYEDIANRELLLNYISDKFSEITSLFFIINTKRNDSISDQIPILFKGEDHITEAMEDMKFNVSPLSFYQTNSEQAYQLYKITRKYACLTGSETVYDLYTGTGTIANFIAQNAKKVIGIEFVPEAIEDAKENSRINNIGNTLFFAGDIKDILTTGFIEQHGHPDVVILDPPRAGVHNNVIDAILFALPQKIVYVSCNPATQARDIALLDAAYQITAVQPVDMFPHTHHVENIILMMKR